MYLLIALRDQMNADVGQYRSNLHQQNIRMGALVLITLDAIY